MLPLIDCVIFRFMTTTYDVIVSGARCAGSPTAMLLARQGHRVLLVDRMRFPSDTISTHLLHPPGVDALDRWGLLDDLAATGCPPITRYTFDVGLELTGSPGTAYGPRRTILDKLLVDAAAQAGAEVREGFTLEEVTFDGGKVSGIRGHAAGGRSVVERAQVVIGADGRHSRVAAAVNAPQYNERPAYAAVYYAYWSGVATEGFEVHIRPERAMAALPTHDGLTLVLVAWPLAEYDANRADVPGNYLKALELAPEFAARVLKGQRQSRFFGTGDLPGFFRRPYGPGWALVGDAGYHKDPCTAQGISDAFRDAELLAGSLDHALSGRRAYDDALGDYHRVRDEHVLPMYDLTSNLATLEPPPAEMQQLLGAAAGNPEAMEAFVSMMAGVLPVSEFFAPENVERIMSHAGV
ncbi:MAG TPA: NAD(P)/FAD-dependent oxidoreductase [Acidimicrobiales bacterium]|jgi:2-polyprenyl-6-methoxyphenol hydroxylase-like FAD-dependent oxidoreductase